MAHPVMSALQHVQFWMDSFHIWNKWSLRWHKRVCRASWPLIVTYIFKVNYDFVTKLLKSVTSCLICSTACTVLTWFFPYLALMITSMRGCVTCSDIWHWPISSCVHAYIFRYTRAYICLCASTMTTNIWFIIFLFNLNRGCVCAPWCI